MFNTYDNAYGGWLFGNNAVMFGGVNPSSWTDGCYPAAAMTADKDVLRTLFTQKGYPGAAAMVYARTRHQFSSTDGEVVVAMFRVKNTTANTIPWRPDFWFSSYGGWSECASVAVNGANYFQTGASTAGSQVTLNLPIPPGGITTVIFVSTSGPPGQFSAGGLYERATVMGFLNRSLDLPAGLEFVDDLETATGGWGQ